MNLNIIKGARISIKITIIYAFMFSFVLLLLNASILYGIRYYLYAQAAKQTDDARTIILNKLNSKGENVDFSDAELVLNVLPKENIFLKIVQQDGKILNISDNFNYVIKINEPFNKITKLEEQGKNLMYEIIKVDNRQYGTVYIQIVKDMAKEYDFLKILLVFMAAGDFTGVIASIVLGYILSKKMLKPIDNITMTAENISINNLKERIDVKGPDDELRRLSNTFNIMIDRLQEAFDRQVQFVSDASHELKTPIAVIQGYANLLDRWGKDDREALEKSIHAIKLETANMADLVEKLLFLAKGDSFTQKIEKKRFQLNELINEVVVESRLISPNQKITSTENDVVTVLADYKMLKQMLRIFIDNSIKFTPEQGKIDISSVMKDNKIKITVSDTGEGIPKDEIDKIFDRFYCADKSRSKEKGGSGLGLSIAKWIADMHHGTISVKSEEGKGTKFIFNANISAF